MFYVDPRQPLPIDRVCEDSFMVGRETTGESGTGDLLSDFRSCGCIRLPMAAYGM